MRLLSGIDPAEQKQAIKKKEKADDTDSFGDIFREWHAHKSKVWSKGYADEMMSMFTDDILPVIGHLRMEDVEPMVLLKVIRLFEDRGQWNARIRPGEDAARCSAMRSSQGGQNTIRRATWWEQ
jgi:hypothetical protein